MYEWVLKCNLFFSNVSKFHTKRKTITVTTKSPCKKIWTFPFSGSLELYRFVFFCPSDISKVLGSLDFFGLLLFDIYVESSVTIDVFQGVFSCSVLHCVCNNVIQNFFSYLFFQNKMSLWSRYKVEIFLSYTLAFNFYLRINSFPRRNRKIR